MLTCFTTSKDKAIPITLVKKNNYDSWLNTQAIPIKSWLTANNYCAESGKYSVIPDANGGIKQVICCVDNPDNMWEVGHLPVLLPQGIYYFDTSANELHSIAWGLGAYQFTRYKKPKCVPAQLYVDNKNLPTITHTVEALYSVRDMINTPADDMGPSELAHVAEKLAKEFKAEFHQIVGENLLKQNYPCIYTVGRASDDAPRLIDLRWGNQHHPKVTLVGKGVCFDTGGLDIKTSPYMLLMKKDMAGGAHVLGLARMIMSAKLPVRLRVLIPAVENAISGNAYRPGDVIKSRKGLTIEVGNTDAEGRVVLADALTEAVTEKPDLLIDMSTLTGAARVALGPDLPAVFSNNDEVVNAVIKNGEALYDPVWRMPLFKLYREYLNSLIADINNNSNQPYAGAITAALFLKEFVPDNIPWLHFDMMAWNICTRPGRPQGGEACALRALFGYIKERFA